MEQEKIDALNELVTAAIQYGAYVVGMELTDGRWDPNGKAPEKMRNATREYAKMTGLDFECDDSDGSVKFKQRGSITMPPRLVRDMSSAGLNGYHEWMEHQKPMAMGFAQTCDGVYGTCGRCGEKIVTMMDSNGPRFDYDEWPTFCPHCGQRVERNKQAEQSERIKIEKHVILA